jgi:hypothetical protein
VTHVDLYTGSVATLLQVLPEARSLAALQYEHGWPDPAALNGLVAMIVGIDDRVGVMWIQFSLVPESQLDD